MATDRDGHSHRIGVLLDANALMAQVQFRIDIFDALGNLIGSCEPLILPEVIEELRGLACSHGKGGAAARSALILSGRCTMVESPGIKGSVDEKILYYANTHGCMVMTNDRDLRNALLGKGIPVISLSGRQRLELYRN